MRLHLQLLKNIKRVQDKKEKVNIKFTAISNKNNAFAMEGRCKDCIAISSDVE